MKLIRLILSVLALSIMTVMLAIGSLIYFFDPNKLEKGMAQAIQNKTGYLMTLDGKSSWSFYPALGIKVSHLTLSSPKEGQFLDLEGVRIEADLLQLLHRAEHFDGNIFIKKVNLLGLNLQNTHIKVSWQNNQFVFEPFEANLYGGSVVGVAQGKYASFVPQIQWEAQISNVAIESLLKDIDGDNKLNLKGLAQIALKAQTEGYNRHQVVSHLNGSMNFSVDHGELGGIDLNYYVEMADAFLNKLAIPDIPNVQKTPFTSLKGSIQIQNGIASTKDAVLTSTAFKTKGKGEINLLDQLINIELLVLPQDELKTKWQIPIALMGDLNHPKFHLDIRQFMKSIEVKDEKSDQPDDSQTAVDHSTQPTDKDGQNDA